MKSKRSVRLGLAAAIWIVLSVAVFGTLIGIAWMSMNAKADVSAGAFIDNVVDDKTTTQDAIRDHTNNVRSPILRGESGWLQHVKGYVSLPCYIGPARNPIAPYYLLAF